MNSQDGIKIFMLGQCMTSGVGVEEGASYPELTRRFLSVRFPNLSFQISLLPLLHPNGLRALISSCLPQRPDVILLSLPAIFASIPYRANQVYLQAPEVMHLARKFVRLIESKIRGDSSLTKFFNKRGAFMPTTVIAPLTVPEYERLITEAVTFCLNSSDCRLVLLGPGGFNEDTEIWDLKSPELCSAVNQMILRVGKDYSVPVINAHEWATGQGGKVFQRGTHRWNATAHEVMAREIESVIAAQLRSRLQNSTADF